MAETSTPAKGQPLASPLAVTSPAWEVARKGVPVGITPNWSAGSLATGHVWNRGVGVERQHVHSPDQTETARVGWGR